MKKEKRAERKKKKQKHHKNNNLLITNCLDTSTSDVTMNNKSDSEDSDADIEDNVDVSIGSNTTINVNYVGAIQENTRTIVIALPAPGEEFPAKGSESGYNSDKVENSSPDSNRINSPGDINVDDSGIPSPAAASSSCAPMSPNSLNNSPASSETNVDMGTNSADEDFGDHTR